LLLEKASVGWSTDQKGRHLALSIAVRAANTAHRLSTSLGGTFTTEDTAKHFFNYLPYWNYRSERFIKAWIDGKADNTKRCADAILQSALESVIVRSLSLPFLREWSNGSDPSSLELHLNANFIQEVGAYRVLPEQEEQDQTTAHSKCLDYLQSKFDGGAASKARLEVLADSGAFVSALGEMCNLWLPT
jgi:hypothetical protein